MSTSIANDYPCRSVSAATWLAWPNFNKRPENIAIDAIVIHNISLPPNEFGACDD